MFFDFRRTLTILKQKKGYNKAGVVYPEARCIGLVRLFKGVMRTDV